MENAEVKPLSSDEKGQDEEKKHFAENAQGGRKLIAEVMKQVKRW